MYKITITNYEGKEIEVVVSVEVYHVFQDCKKIENKMRNEEARKWDMRGLDDVLTNQARYASYSIVEEITTREALEKSEIQLQQLLDRIYFILNQCTEKQRERFLLYAVHGYTIQEIADFEVCSKVAVHYSIKKVLAKLRSEL